MYVRVTTGDTDRQLQQLRELMDAGVFVLTGGPDAPRTKTRDSDPVAQYTLTFRKLLGISSAIGLSQRDRFELSGQHLVDWLDNPSDSSELLKRNLAAGSEDVSGQAAGESANQRSKASAITKRGRTQPSVDAATLFDGLSDIPEGTEREGGPHTTIPYVSVTESSIGELADFRPHTLVTGRGFEERTFESSRRLVAEFTPEQTLLVTYPLDGFGTQIDELLGSKATVISRIASEEKFVLPDSPREGLGVVDTTGLSKAFIYHSVRELLNRDGRVLVVHTGAEHHYPLNDEVAVRLASAPDDEYLQLEACRDILTGEQEPYSFDALHPTDVDDGRRRVLFASSSAKHERLFSLLEQRDYDHVEILVPSGSSPRAALARLAARVAAHDFHSCRTREVSNENCEEVVLAVRAAFEEFYGLSNYNFEVGLTGSKLHAVAVAAASSTLKFSQVWYVRPNGFDIDRFTTGFGSTRMLLIEKEDSGPS